MEGSDSDRFAGIDVDRLSACEVGSLLELARLAAIASFKRGEVLTAPCQVRRYLMAAYSNCKDEYFGVLYLDVRHRIVEFKPEVFRGTIDGTSVHPRVIVREALELNAAAVIFVHNHPSGVPEPSLADEKLTTTLRDALKLVDVRVLDHVVVSDTGSVSFAERGLL